MGSDKKRERKNWGRGRKEKDWIGRERKSKKAKRKERTGNDETGNVRK